MKLSNRLEKLERAFNIGAGGQLCGCKGMAKDVRVFDEESPERNPDAETRPAAICEVCRRPKQVLIIRIVTAQQTTPGRVEEFAD
jgi:hypothetical protein